MGSEFEIRNIRKFDDDLKLIYAYCAAFAIARELRHAYQCARHRKKYFADYKDASTGTGVERYNLPPAEVDANTFAAALMPAMFGVPPLLNGVPDTVKAAIMPTKMELCAICSIFSLYNVCYAQIIKKISTYAE